MDRRIKFRHIETFVEICRQNSLKRAGEQLGLTQPAMSKTLKDLEDILGAELMTRGRGGVRLTAAGEVFLQFAESSLGALQQGFDGVARLQTGGSDHISVGGLPSVAARVLPRASLLFRALAPGAILKFMDGPHRFLIERLRTGRLDLVVGRMGPPETMKGISFTQLYSETVAIVVRAGHPASNCTSLHQLRDWPVIFPASESAIRPLVERLMIAEGASEFADRIETVSGAYGRGLVRKSDAIWWISEGVVADDIESGMLVKLPIDTGLTSGPVGMMTRADEPTGALVQVFRRALTDAIAELGL